MAIGIKTLFQQAIPLQEWTQALPEFSFEQIGQILEQLFVGFDLIFEMPDLRRRISGSSVPEAWVAFGVCEVGGKSA